MKTQAHFVSNRRLFISIVVLALAALACSTLSTNPNSVVGSGHVISESRTVPAFTAVELQGSSTVDVVPGSVQSVTVQADDNILPLITTSVSSGTLIINTKSNTSLVPTTQVHVTVVMNNPMHLALTGSGTLNASGVTGPDLTVDLTGSGNVTVKGTTDHVTINLPGSGNVYCDSLTAKSVVVTLLGSGTIQVYASQSLDATIAGSGTIRYSGNPPQVTKHISGSGSIVPQ